MKKTTITEMYLNGGYNTIIEMTIYECECKKYNLPLEDYVASIDGDLDEYCEDWLIHKYAEDYNRIEIIDNNLVLIELPDKQCYDCHNGKTYAKDMPLPEQEGFKDVVKMHGILAYEREHDDFIGAKEHLAKVLNNPNYETCASTEAIGRVGVILDGTVVLASNCDLGSKCDTNGRYFYKHWKEAEHIIYDAQDLSFGVDGMNDEMIMRDCKIQAVWYKENSNNEEKAFAQELASFYDVPLVEEEMTEMDKSEAIYFY